jgi:hypothetical protein
MKNIEKCKNSLELSYFWARKFHKTKDNMAKEKSFDFFRLALSFWPVTNFAILELYKNINGFYFDPRLN